ncbi:hypothetical protein [Planctomicrobium piriforme]|uniref:Uncharacterized protein n=1 Tax=Planctomicrobium piriforme TaxID=1576369 RepID=A0A1I3HY22_9PLAN|nr:hypothetical protein [Planctomicrobium piriforme]SFI40591.1 hypothetical protein SAMN05421753_108238 [Planctomicrobium piriforme]
MPRTLSRSSFLSVLALLAGLNCGDVSHAQQPASVQPGGVAVLNDGRVFKGEITEVPGGYRVAQPGGGNMILPFQEVSVTSMSLVGAYEAYRDSIKKPSADSHISLAEWCVGNGLWSQAYTEVQSALKLEPMRSDAHALLKQIDTMVGAKSPATAPPSAPAPLPVNAFAAPIERAANGLSRSAQQEFVTHIQPLIMNRCASGACHGQVSENGLKLMNVRYDGGNHRIATETNVKALTAYIDLKQPRRSPLLTKSTEATRAHENLFAGAKQQQQLAYLERWILLVAQEKTGVPATLPGRAPVATPLNAGMIQQASASQIVPSLQPTTAPQLSPIPSNSPMLQQARRGARPDAFDPNAFNSQMHGPTAVSPAPPAGP